MLPCIIFVVIKITFSETWPCLYLPASLSLLLLYEDECQILSVGMSDAECQVLFQNCQLAMLQWGWSVVSRGDCRLDRVVSLFLRKAGGVFKMLVGKSVLSSPFLCRRTWFSNLRVEWEGSWLDFLWFCWLVVFWFVCLFFFFLNSGDLNTEAIWILAE